MHARTINCARAEAEISKIFNCLSELRLKRQIYHVSNLMRMSLTHDRSDVLAVQVKTVSTYIS